MGLIEVASGNSVWRGMDYYERKKVISWEEDGADSYNGVVSGSEGNIYLVHIDKAHPRKSKCNCPFADGRRVVCKHSKSELQDRLLQALIELEEERESYW